MAKRAVLVTGSSGLIGSGACTIFDARGYAVHGLDNNQRAELFGPKGDTRWNQERMQRSLRDFTHHEMDVRDRAGVAALVKEIRPCLIIHAAAQPSHDLAASIPYDNFDINATGTLNLLEAARQFCPESPFVYLSTNKVYGDSPNDISMEELDTRWDFGDPAYSEGISESFPIDQSMHTLFGVSKCAGDLLVQEYGRYFGMPTCCIRGGCLTGPCQSAVEQHGFLGYLVKCNLEGLTYHIRGYKGKQVRDNIHVFDVVAFIYEFYQAPRKGEVYNLGGGKENSCSILEAFKFVEELTGKPMLSDYDDKHRPGDHICYYSDLRKVRSHFPSWNISYGLDLIFRELVEAWRKRIQH